MKLEKKAKIAPPAAVFPACLALALAAACGCAKKSPPPPPAARPVQTAVAQRQDADIFTDTFGVMTARADVDVKSRAAGQIMEIFVRDGQQVAEGDILFLVDPREYRAALDKAEAALHKDMVDLKRRRDVLERNRELFDKNLISKQDFEDYQTSVAEAEAIVEADEAEAETARLQLEYCEVRSPMEGVAGKRMVDVGAIVGAGTGPTLVNVKTVSPLYIDFTISERYLSDARTAIGRGEARISIFPRDGSGRLIGGSIEAIENAVDQTTGTIGLRGLTPNEDLALWPGQFVDVRLVLGVMSNAVVAPAGAVMMGKDGYFAFVVDKDNKAELRHVDMGMRLDETVVVLKGIQAGETVVTAGQLGLWPGAPVTAAAPPAAAKPPAPPGGGQQAKPSDDAGNRPVPQAGAAGDMLKEDAHDKAQAPAESGEKQPAPAAE